MCDGIELVYNEETGEWEERKEPFATIEVVTEEDFQLIKAAIEEKKERDKGCECCEGRELFVGYDLGNGDTLDIYIDADAEEGSSIDILLWSEERKKHLVDDSRVCNYCPNCGRKLG